MVSEWKERTSLKQSELLHISSSTVNLLIDLRNHCSIFVETNLKSKELSGPNMVRPQKPHAGHTPSFVHRNHKVLSSPI